MTTVRVMNLPIPKGLVANPSRPVEVLPPIEVTTDRLNFRPLIMADRHQVLPAIERTRDQLIQRLPMNRTDESGRTENDLEMFTRWVETAADSDNNRTAWRRAAFLDDGTFVGCFNLIKIERGLEWACEINCWVDADQQGMGYAREGVDGLLQYAAADLPVGLGLHTVAAWIQADNAPSRSVASSLGFRATSEMDLLEINGVVRPHERFIYAA